MSKSKSFRRQPRNMGKGQIARIIKDIKNTDQDRFVPLEHAESMFNLGKLIPVKLGNAYPNAYREV